MRRSTDALFLTAAMFLSAACSSSPPTAQRAQKSTAVAQHPAPIEFLQDPTGFSIVEQVNVDPAVRADYDSAIRLLEQKQYQQGIAMLVKVTQAAPGVTAVHIDLGIAYSRAGDLEKAKASLLQALALNPKHPIAHNELGMVLRRKGEFPAARANYEQALAVYPGFHFAQRNLAILCDLYLADRECAVTNYEAYLRNAPDDQEVTKWLADLRGRAAR